MKAYPPIFNSQKRKGVVLILTIGILALLSLLAVALASNTLFERNEAQNYLNGLKAKYLAEAGVAKAIAELKYGTEGALSNGIDTTTEGWYSGYSDSTWFSGRGEYNVAIVDCASRIYLNDGNPRLAQILKNLNTALGLPLTDADLDNIAANAPYTTKEMIKTVTGITEAKYNAIRDYITVNAYVDPNTIDPQDVVPPNYGAQPRAPINVNTASQQAIQAILTGLKADNACPTCGGDGYINAAYEGHPDCPSCDGTGSPVNNTGDLDVDSTEAPNLAAYIVSNRPYSTWRQFYNSISTLASMDPKDEDLVLANVNPNTGFAPGARNVGWGGALGYVGKYVVDSGNGVVDSSDKGLTTSTTEFSFNSGGYYEIESTGTLKDSSGSTLAQRKVRAIVKIFDIFRQTTQAQFESGSKTSVATYPEPSGVGVSPAVFDGQIMLATKQSSSPSSGTHFRADYETTLNPDSLGGNNPNLMIPPLPSTKPAIASVTGTPSNRGNLLPDGMLVNDALAEQTMPFYYALNNISADAGTIEIWFKSTWNSNDTRIYMDSDQNKKMMRLTSGTSIWGIAGDSAVPFLLFWFWSDWDTLYSRAIRGGGRYQYDLDTGVWFWDWEQGYFWWNWGVFGWNAGKWNQLVFTWRNPPVPEGDPPGNYTIANNPVAFYFNGVLKATDPYYYHTPCADTGTSRELMIGCESSVWTGWAVEISNSIIGKVRIWDSELSAVEILANYNDGMYVSSGTFISSAFNPGSSVEWGTITWTEAVPADTDIVMDVDTTGVPDFVGNWDDPANGNPMIGSPVSSIISYRATFTTSSTPPIDTPVLEDVTITYLPQTQVLYWRGIDY